MSRGFRGEISVAGPHTQDVDPFSIRKHSYLFPCVCGQDQRRDQTSEGESQWFNLLTMKQLNKYTEVGGQESTIWGDAKFMDSGNCLAYPLSDSLVGKCSYQKQGGWQRKVSLA